MSLVSRTQEVGKFWHCLPGLVVVFGVAVAQPSVAQEKQPVPDRTAQREAIGRIRSLFEDEYAATNASQRVEFAKQLYKLAKSERDDVAKFSLLREAVRFASENGDVNTAMEAVNLLAEQYAISADAVRSYALSNLSEASLSPEAAVAAADECLVLANELVAENKFQQAEKTVSYGLASLRRQREPERVARLREMGDTIKDVARQFQSVKSHAETLEQNPDDPAANLELGKFECFVKGNWSGGLEHLAKGSDAQLKQLAAETLSNPSDAKAQLKIANGWWKQAEGLKGVARDRALGYAGGFYEQALPGLSGLSKATAEKRLSEVPAAASALTVQRERTINLLELIEPDKDLKPQDKWALADGVLQCTRGSFVPKVIFPYQPPEEYDVTFTYSQPRFRNGVGIIMPNPNGQTSFGFYVGGDRGKALGIFSDDGKYKRKFDQQFVREHTKYKVLFQVRKEGIHAEINGTAVADLKTDFRDFSVSTWHHINEWQNLAIFCDDPTTFYEVQVKEVSGEGVLTRFPKSD